MQPVRACVTTVESLGVGPPKAAATLEYMYPFPGSKPKNRLGVS